jgi:hypothetical protein
VMSHPRRRYRFPRNECIAMSFLKRKLQSAVADRASWTAYAANASLNAPVSQVVVVRAFLRILPCHSLAASRPTAKRDRSDIVTLRVPAT